MSLKDLIEKAVGKPPEPASQEVVQLNRKQHRHLQKLKRRAAGLKRAAADRAKQREASK